MGRTQRPHAGLPDDGRGLVARVANAEPDPLRFITEFRDEVRAVIDGINIAGPADAVRIRRAAQASADELFSLMKPPSEQA